MFRNCNLDGTTYRTHKFAKTSVAQDERQVWFAGVHADVGGGYLEAESGLAKFPLQWMLGEAKAKGLRTSQTMARHLVDGQPLTGGKLSYAMPDAAAPLHQHFGESGGCWNAFPSA